MLMFIGLVGAMNLFAQIEEPDLTEEQKWVMAKTEQFYKTAGINISRQVVLQNFRELLASNKLCEPSFGPDINIHLEGNRLDEKSTILKWDVTAEKNNARYIVERRFINPHGAFDSVGMIAGPGKPNAFQSYRFGDQNDFPGITWYRLRRIGGPKEENKLISVKGYNSCLKVLPNPTRSSDIYIQLTGFKTDNQTSMVISDSRGSLVHRVSGVFNGTNIYQLSQLRLTPGTYHIKVANQFNTSTTTFVVQ